MSLNFASRPGRRSRRPTARWGIAPVMALAASVAAPSAAAGGELPAPPVSGQPVAGAGAVGDGTARQLTLITGDVVRVGEAGGGGLTQEVIRAYRLG